MEDPDVYYPTTIQVIEEEALQAPIGFIRLKERPTLPRTRRKPR